MIGVGMAANGCGSRSLILHQIYAPTRYYYVSNLQQNAWDQCGLLSGALPPRATNAGPKGHLMRGGRFVDAAVSGMEAAPIEGHSGDVWRERKVFDQVSHCMNALETRFSSWGSVGSGRLTKLINQLLFDINSTALAEVLPMDVKMGLDPAMMSDVINSGTGKSYASEFFIPRMHKGDFSAGYPVKEAYKDLVSAFPCRF